MLPGMNQVLTMTLAGRKPACHVARTMSQRGPKVDTSELTPFGQKVYAYLHRHPEQFNSLKDLAREAGISGDKLTRWVKPREGKNGLPDSVIDMALFAEFTGMSLDELLCDEIESSNLKAFGEFVSAWREAPPAVRRGFLKLLRARDLPE